MLQLTKKTIRNRGKQAKLDQMMDGIYKKQYKTTTVKPFDRTLCVFSLKMTKYATNFHFTPQKPKH